MRAADGHHDTAIEVVVEPSVYDAAVDLLWQHGAAAVAEVEGADGSTTLLAGFEPARIGNEAPDMAPVIGALRLLGARPRTITIDADAGWLTTWRAGEPSHSVGPFHLRLPEHQAVATAVVTPIDLVIEPSTTFGFSHASTRLALALLGGLDLTQARVADIGCGSGVLAIAAAKLGAASVHAVDIDDHAVDTTIENAHRNEIELTAIIGSVGALPSGAYDLVLANLTAGTSTALAPNLVPKMARNARLLVSGLLASQAEAVRRAFSGLTVEAELGEGQWHALLLHRPE